MRYLKEGKGKTSENFKSGKDGADGKSYDLELECVYVGVVGMIGGWKDLIIS